MVRESQRSSHTAILFCFLNCYLKKYLFLKLNHYTYKWQKDRSILTLSGQMVIKYNMFCAHWCSIDTQHGRNGWWKSLFHQLLKLLCASVLNSMLPCIFHSHTFRSRTSWKGNPCRSEYYPCFPCMWCRHNLLKVNYYWLEDYQKLKILWIASFWKGFICHFFHFYFC